MRNILNDYYLKSNRKHFFWIFIFVLVGIIFRFIWISDMEWKWDEFLMYDASIDIAKTGKLPLTGMRSGGGIENPGLSMWIFGIIAKITTDPVKMVKVIVFLNVVALLGFLLFAIKKFNGVDREIWLWGLSLAAVSPIAILFTRKLWAQDILPFFSLVILICHQYRNKNFGALLWGLVGAIIGQIHMSGFFFSFGLFIFSLWYDYNNRLKTKWIAWLVGSVIGVIPLIPWIIYLFANATQSKLSFMHIFQFNFFIYWFIDPLGLNMTYTLRGSIFDFMKFPWIKGYNTYLVTLIHLGLLIIAGYVLRGVFKKIKVLFILLKNKKLSSSILSDKTSNNFYLFSIFIGLGFFMTLSCVWIHPHYLIVAFPFPYIFIVKMLYPNLKRIKILLVLQLLLTMFFLKYIHNTQGTDKSEYGKTYKYKIENNQSHTKNKF